MNFGRRFVVSGCSLALLGLMRPAHSSKVEDKHSQCFIWGNGYYQATPNQGLSFQNFTPKLINDATPLNLRSLFLSEFYEGGISSQGEVWVWESQKISSTPDPDVDDTRRKNIVKLVCPEKASIKLVKFTKQYLWILTTKGNVYQYPIEKKIHQETKEIEQVQLIMKPRKIESLSKIKQIDTGEDHFIALDENGAVFAMGDDTYGQCGLGKNQRSTAPPFYEQRIRNPQQITVLPNVSKVVCGGNHTIAIGVQGGIYGWGSNSKMQLSQQSEFSKVDEPLIAVYSPIRISTLMEANNKVVDAALGEEFTIITTENKLNGETEVFGFGYNLRGELGAGFSRHLNDVVKIDSLSNYRIQTKEGEQNVNIKQIQCGKNHCMALLNIGALLEWGDNEYGQLGNKKRSFSEKPIIMSAFSNDNILNIACGNVQSGVLLEKVKGKTNDQQQQKK